MRNTTEARGQVLLRVSISLETPLCLNNLAVHKVDVLVQTRCGLSKHLTYLWKAGQPRLLVRWADGGKSINGARYVRKKLGDT